MTHNETFACVPGCGFPPDVPASEANVCHGRWSPLAWFRGLLFYPVWTGLQPNRRLSLTVARPATAARSHRTRSSSVREHCNPEEMP